MEIRYRQIGHTPGFGIVPPVPYYHVFLLIRDNCPGSPTKGRVWMLRAGPAHEPDPQGGFGRLVYLYGEYQSLITINGNQVTNPDWVPNWGDLPSTLLEENNQPWDEIIAALIALAKKLDAIGIDYAPLTDNSNAFIGQVLEDYYREASGRYVLKRQRNWDYRPTLDKKCPSPGWMWSYILLILLNMCLTHCLQRRD